MSTEESLLEKGMPAEEQKKIVDFWNRNYPPGTQVYTSKYGSRIVAITRARALPHSSGQPVIWLQGDWGITNLKDVEPVQKRRNSI